ncbi:ABC-type branched-subunit amino acid transport system ATPase component [Bradyrhizobium diazoefficiens]
MLEIRNLAKSFGGVKATNDVTLDFPDGSLTAVIGPNGAGKSTFFNLITGALRPDSGEVLLDGVDLAGRSPPEIVRHGIGRAFQVASIFKSLTVQETMLAAVSADQRTSAVLHKRFPLPETRDRAEHVMELLGLSGKRNRTAATLSHGDQKLLDIALALVLEPKVLLLDEPTAGTCRRTARSSRSTRSRTISSSVARRGRKARTSGRSSASMKSSRCWSRCAIASPDACRAVSSRCWRSRAR